MLPLIAELDFLDADRIAQITGGVVVRGSGRARGLTTDTRHMRAADLFVAVVGDRHDGHDFVADALERGARGLLVSEFPDVCVGDCFVVLVGDTRKALCALAAAHRAELATTVVGLTGSCGKTTTKEMLAHLTGAAKRVVAAPGSFNNDVGVPLTLFQASQATEVCIVEVGTNAPGEVARLARVARPDIGLITMIGRGHLAGLGSIEGVAEEKASLLDALGDGGCAVLNADDRYFAMLRGRAAECDVVTFGVRRNAEWRATELRPLKDGVAFQLACPGHRGIAVELPRFGVHNVRNLVAALAIGDRLGVELDAMLARVAELRAAPRRLEAKQGRGGLRLIDDSYNANPESLLAALAVLDTMPGARRRVLVLGDMLELGPEAERIHASFGPQLVSRIQLLVTVGELARRAGTTFIESGGSSVAFDRVDDLLPELGGLLTSGDLVLIKGSRRTGLDRAVDALTIEPT